MLFEVAYAKPDHQVILKVELDENSSVKQIIEASGVLETFPEIDLGVNKIGIFGKLTKLDKTDLREGDRIEIYRPLIADPKEVRRKRAEEGKRMKKGGGDIEQGAGKENSSESDAGK